MSTHSAQNEMTLKGNEIEYAKRKKHFTAALLFLRSQLVYFLLV